MDEEKIDEIKENIGAEDGREQDSGSFFFEEVPDEPDDYMKYGANKGASKVSFITGIVSLVFCPIPCLTILSIPLGLTALISGFFGIKDEITKKKSILGMIFGGVGLFLCILFMVLSWTLQIAYEVI